MHNKRCCWTILYLLCCCSERLGSRQSRVNQIRSAHTYTHNTHAYMYICSGFCTSPNEREGTHLLFIQTKHNIWVWSVLICLLRECLSQRVDGLIKWSWNNSIKYSISALSNIIGELFSQLCTSLPLHLIYGLSWFLFVAGEARFI